MGTKINLITQYYKTQDEDRQKEIDDCIRYNVANDNIDFVYLLISVETTIPEDIDKSKLNFILFEKRPTYSDFLSYVKNFYDNDIWIIANTDIYYDQSIAYLRNINFNNTILCLSRWNLPGVKLTPNTTTQQFSLQYNPEDSHDSWIIGEVPSDNLINNVNFSLGIPGCDGKFCYIAKQHGYELYNPCYEIISIHNHVTNKKTYTEEQRLKTPYGQVKPSKLEFIK